VKNPLKEFRRLKNAGEYQVYGRKKNKGNYGFRKAQSLL
jgi:hypothetical protein